MIYCLKYNSCSDDKMYNLFKSMPFNHDLPLYYKHLNLRVSYEFHTR